MNKPGESAYIMFFRVSGFIYTLILPFGSFNYSLVRESRNPETIQNLVLRNSPGLSLEFAR